MLEIESLEQNKLPNKIQANAYAKINLFLDIIGRRENGYHNLEMLMQDLCLCDTLEFSVNNSDNISIDITDEIGLESSELEVLKGKANIIYKTANNILESYTNHKGVDIKLTKRIPVAGGLAGGSTDCAAVINSLNRLFNLHLTDKDKFKLGLTYGADVPYCLHGGLAYVTGIGENIHSLSAMRGYRVLLVSFNEGILTKDAFNQYDNNPVYFHRSSRALRIALKNKSNNLQPLMYNVLEKYTNRKEIQYTKQFLIKYGAVGAMMSGSGPTVFGLFNKKKTLLNAKKIIEENILQEYKGKCLVTKIKD